MCLKDQSVSAVWYKLKTTDDDKMSGDTLCMDSGPPIAPHIPTLAIKPLIFLILYTSQFGNILMNQFYVCGFT